MEALAGERGVGIDIKTVQNMAWQTRKFMNQLKLPVIEGKPLWELLLKLGMDRVQADHTGMLGTVKANASGWIRFNKLAWDTRVQIRDFAGTSFEPYIRGRALSSP